MNFPCGRRGNPTKRDVFKSRVFTNTYHIVRELGEEAKMGLSKVRMLLLCIIVTITESRGAVTAVTDATREFAYTEPGEPISRTNAPSSYSVTTQEPGAVVGADRDNSEHISAIEDTTVMATLNERSGSQTTTAALVDGRHTLGDTSDNTQPAKTIDLLCPYNHSDHIQYIRWYKVFSSGSVHLLTQRDITITSDLVETVGNVTKVSLDRVKDLCDGIYICSAVAKVGHVSRQHRFIVSNCTVSGEKIDNVFDWTDSNKKRLLPGKSSAHVKQLDSFVVISMCVIGFLIY